MSRSTPYTTGVSREEFLRAVRAALEPRPPEPAPDAPSVPDDLVRIVPRSADTIDLFTARARTSGMRPVVTGDLAESLRAILDRHRPRRVAVGIRDPVLLLAVARMLHERGIETLTTDSPARPTQASDTSTDRLFDADLGITDVHAAVAETGSLVMTSGLNVPRGAALIPPVHVAVVAAERIVPDLLDLFRAHAAEPPPTSLTLITGPSKTADIEGILITGVHGPREVEVIVLTPPR